MKLSWAAAESLTAAVLRNARGKVAASLMHILVRTWESVSSMRRALDHRWARFARWSTLALLVGALVSMGGSALAQMPNIVYILADDMGLGDVRSYSPTSPVNTPNIDRIANAGMRFTNAHSSDSVCTPTRYSLMTGQYAFRGALNSGVLAPFAGPIIDPSRLTVADMLKASGYSTAAFGKWHLGSTWTTTNGQAPAANGSNVNFSVPITGGAVDQGFDTFFGVDGSTNYPPYTFIRDRQAVGSDLVTPAIPTGQVQGNPTGQYNSPGPISPGYNISNALPTIVNEATSYISSKANQASPFFAYMPLTAPHHPINPPNFLAGSSGQGAYGDFIAAVDWSVGQVLDTLSDPNHDGNTADSIVNNTLVVFTSDNGADKLFSFSTSTGAVNGVPLRNEKASIYEGGARLPLLAQWAGHIPVGAVNDHQVELNDFMATAANVVGYTLPTNAAEDSYNILPELLGTATSPVRSLGVQRSTNGTYAIRQTDTAGNEWKLIFNNGDGNTTGTKVDPKNPLTNFSTVQLYNLKTDPGEQTNLLSGGGTASAQQKALQLQGFMQTYLYAGRSVNIPPRTGTNGTTVMHVDFGPGSQTTAGAGFNNFSGTAYLDPTISKVLYDEGGGFTNIQMKSQFVNGSVSTGVSPETASYQGPYPAELAGVPADALKDSFFVQDGDKLVITLSALDAHATYDFLFYSADRLGQEYTLFTVTGATSAQDHIAPVKNNATQVAHINGIMADATKSIRIDVEGRRADGSLQNPSVLFDAGGTINYLRIIEHLLEIPGDYNNDRLVDSADYAAWRQAFGTAGTSLADGNHDGAVNAADYVIWRNAFNAIPAAGSGGSFGQSAAVPEPAMAQLAIMAFIAICGTQARRRPGRPVRGDHLV